MGQTAPYWSHELHSYYKLKIFNLYVKTAHNSANGLLVCGIVGRYGQRRIIFINDLDLHQIKSVAALRKFTFIVLIHFT